MTSTLEPREIVFNGMLTEETVYISVYDINRIMAQELQKERTVTK